MQTAEIARTQYPKQDFVEQTMQLGSIRLHWPPSLRLINEQFFDFCQANRGLRIERTAQGDYEIMAPTGGATGCRNARLIAALTQWADQESSGIAFDSSTGFVLPNGAIRSPDVSWVKKSRLAALTPEQKQRFLPLCPDVVIELRSASDNLKNLQDKMQEYAANGAMLGWLIDTQAQTVWVYQANAAVISLDKPDFLSADDVLAGFQLAMQKLWDVAF